MQITEYLKLSMLDLSELSQDIKMLGIDYLKIFSGNTFDNLKKIENFAVESKRKFENNEINFNSFKDSLNKVDNTKDVEKNVLSSISADKFTTDRLINGISFDGSKDIIIEDSTKISLDLVGVANGIASLDIGGKVPSFQLPSYVDDVINRELKSDLPLLGEEDKIYVVYGDTSQNNGTYRWSGTVYVLIDNPLEYATESEAISGIDNTKVMTPMQVKTAINNNTKINGLQGQIDTINVELVGVSTLQQSNLDIIGGAG